MKILSLNQDKGIGGAKKKGASVHLSAIRKAFTALGHAVTPIDNPDQDALQHLYQTSPPPFDLVYERYALGQDGGSRLAQHLRIPHVLEVNAPLAEEAQRWRGDHSDGRCAELERGVFSNAHHVIAVSEDTRRYSIQRGAAADRVSVIANGYDPQVFYPRDRDTCKAELGLNVSDFVIGFHGRLRPWHRFEDLVDAVAKLQHLGVPAHLLTIGEGDYAQIASSRLSSSAFTHVPWVPVDELGRYVAAYDVLPLMYAADEPCYFSPLKLLEAMACGAVPVVPDVGQMKDAVQHEQTGLVYGEEAMVNNLQRLYFDQSLRRTLSGNCAAAATPHTWGHVAATTLRCAGLREEAA